MQHWAMVVLGLLVLGAGGCERKVAEGRSDGAALFAAACARCHGATGKPGPQVGFQLGVRDLSAPAFHERTTDAEIRARIVHGSDDRRMPAFAGAFTDEQLDALVHHVRSLRKP